MPLNLITPPAVEPVTLADAKAHLKVDTTDDDALITALITAARARAEWHTGRALITQSWTLWLDAWPAERHRRDSAAAAAERDVGDELCAATTRATRARSGALRRRYAATSASRCAQNSVIAAISCASSMRSRSPSPPAMAMRRDVPQRLKTAILELIAFLYENRGEAPADLPVDCAGAAGAVPGVETMIGALDQRATLLARTLTPDGGGGFSEGWDRVRGGVDRAHAGLGDERRRRRSPGIRVRHRITLRRRNDLAAGQRAIVGARTFRVHGVLDEGPRAQYVTLQCEELP